ncbi:MAG TPA: DUF423 domain-containing protein [Blastocatellia bacterium]|nr:DUF423 domain-containing protein [Blastocatellia bacterium]
MDRTFFTLGSISALISVAMGAFGAHGLRSRISPEMLTVFETGARYQMYHALALLAVAWAYVHRQNSLTAWAGWAFVLGTVFFSGSLYILSITGTRWLGAITPIGGLLFLAGWFLLALSAWQK